MRHSAEEKIRIVLDGLRGEDSIAELCRREGIAQSLYYSWSKEFLEAGKKRLAGDTARKASSGEVKDLWREAWALDSFTSYVDRGLGADYDCLPGRSVRTGQLTMSSNLTSDLQVKSLVCDGR